MNDGGSPKCSAKPARALSSAGDPSDIDGSQKISEIELGVFAMVRDDVHQRVSSRSESEVRVTINGDR